MAYQFEKSGNNYGEKYCNSKFIHHILGAPTNKSFPFGLRSPKLPKGQFESSLIHYVLVIPTFKKYNAISRCARLVSLSYNPFPKNLNFLRATRVTTLHSRNTKNHSTVATCQPIYPSPPPPPPPPLPLPTPLKLGPNRAHSPHP